MMVFMDFRFSLIMVLLIGGCTTRTPQAQSWEGLWSRVQMVGEGRARLEIPPESWVFSFEAHRSGADWTMALAIPLKGEEVLQFAGLNHPRPVITPDERDFRWQVIHALRAAASERRLAHPNLGQDFVNALHHLLRWSQANVLGLSRDCQAEALQWSCRWDGVPSTWSWHERREEFSGVIEMKSGWQLRAVFKNLTNAIFKRVTIEVVRAQKANPTVELRQEFFFR